MVKSLLGFEPEEVPSLVSTFFWLVCGMSCLKCCLGSILDFSELCDGFLFGLCRSYSKILSRFIKGIEVKLHPEADQCALLAGVSFMCVEIFELAKTPNRIDVAVLFKS